MFLLLAKCELELCTNSVPCRTPRPRAELCRGTRTRQFTGCPTFLHMGPSGLAPRHRADAKKPTHGNTGVGGRARTHTKSVCLTSGLGPEFLSPPAPSQGKRQGRARLCLPGWGSLNPEATDTPPGRHSTPCQGHAGPLCGRRLRWVLCGSQCSIVCSVIHCARSRGCSGQHGE